MDKLRTPEGRFADLPGWQLPPRYADVDDSESATLRMHYVDEGPRDGQVIVLLHGEPSWAYLHRHMVGVLVEAGLRVIVPDHVGFGRSDKPAQVEDHTYARHVEWTRALLLDVLDLQDVTLFGQDWGGLIGLRLVGEHPERFARVVAANTALLTGDQTMPDLWWRFHDFVARTPELPVGFLVASGCTVPMSDEVRAAYDAPFPDASYQAGARAMPQILPKSPDDVAAPACRAAWESLGRFERPFLTVFGDSDPITRGADRVLQAHVPGAAGQPHATIVDAGHFLQETHGPELARVIADFVAAT